MKKKVVLCLLAIVALTVNSFAQEVFVNRTFQDESGNPQFNPILNPFGIQWSSSITNGSGQLITVGHTQVSGQGENIFLIKYSVTGSVIFSVDYNTSSTNNDYGIGVFEAGNGDILVCGTTDNGGTTDYDVVILRYSSTGSFIGSVTSNGAGGKNDIAVSITEDGSGNIFVAANTQVVSGFYNYWVLKYSSGLGLLANNTYDYTGLEDIALGVEISTSGDIYIIGASMSGTAACDYAVAKFSPGTLNYISDVRNNIPGTALDQALAFCKDASNNTYITGKAWNGTDFDIKTVKITSGFSIAWTATLDVNGMDDIANTIAVDPTNGNVIIGGFYNRSGNITDMISVRYNSSNGSTISTYKQQAENPSGNAAIKKLCTSATGNVYFVAGEKGNSGFMQVLVGKLNLMATSGWQRQIVHISQDILPSDIEVTPDGIFAISVVDSTIDSYLTTAYEELTLDTTRAYVGGQPGYMANELLIDFHPSAINKAAIDNQVGTRIAEFGDLSDFLTSTANSAVITAFESACPDCHFKAVRVHADMKTTDTMCVGRLGQNMINPPVWSILDVIVPNSISQQQAKTIFRSLRNYVSYVQYNNFMEPTSPPNDSLYSVQANLHAVSPNTNAHINVEDAWNVVTGCGASFVKGGVFDTGVMWRHKDFGYTGSLTSGKVEGWLFAGGFGPSSQTWGGVNIRQNPGNGFPLTDLDLDNWSVNGALGHGTQAAGIIGAKRNNTSGVAGIAGGDDSNGNNGVSLYSLNVVNMNKMFWLLKAYHAAHGGPTASNLPYNYGVHFSNHSYQVKPAWFNGIDSFPLYRDEVHFANRANVTFVASRGNDNNGLDVAPVTYDSCWIVSVGGSDSTGLRWSGSNWGKRMDVIAPATPNIVRKSTANNRYYSTFDGTSASAPHVSGVVALAMSYMNDPNNPNYYWNLAPEDCDYIIQRSATDVGPAGYDSLTGYGRLNAGAALRMIEKPFRNLHHFGTNPITPHSISKSVHQNYDTVKLTEKYVAANNTVYNPGKYFAKIFKIEAIISHPGLYVTDSVMHKWARHSSSNVFDLPNAQKKLDMHERTFFVSFSPTSATLKGYIYQIKDSNNVNALGWWPDDTTFSVLNSKGFSLMEYSVLTKNKAVGINEHENDRDNIVSIFPNPTKHGQTIVVKCSKDADCKIELFDLMGRHMKTVFNGRIYNGSTNVSQDVGGLANSMYIYVVNLDGKITTRKFIKE